MPLLLLVALALSLAPAAARAAPTRDAPSGFTVAPSLGAGGDLGDGEGVSELEIRLGWEFGDVRPEVGLVLGLAPGTYSAVRPGLQVAIRDVPFYARGALDFSHDRGHWQARWLLLGPGAELRFTSVLGLFAELDLGIPVNRDYGLGVLFRAGAAFRL